MIRRLVTFLTVASIALAGVLGTGAAGPTASAAVPHPARHFSVAIEDYTAYVPQDSCDPRPKRGTTLFGDMLARNYRGIAWSTYRPCDGSVSEHHDGRAIDWMVSSRNGAQHQMGIDFWHWLLATDRYGNQYAMARRLGVMYIIFNGRMWGMWDQKWSEYLHCRTTQKGAAYDNLCHRTHMHISLSWNGARGLTSYWTGREYPTDYGPCVPKHHTYAPRWARRNLTPCG
ncbi:MAG TPA: hypothetical protein VIG48_09185 [Jatrophihabitans sp.]|jgi:hypothetical protein